MFPAFFRAGEAVAAKELGTACSFHPGKPAVGTCSRCERPVCGLCELEIGGRRLCPPCANLGGKEGKLGPLETEALRYDRLALIFGLWPLILIFTLWIFWPVYLLTAGVTFYLVVRHWGTPAGAFIPRPRGRLVLAAALAVLQLAVAAGFAWATVLLVRHIWS